MYALYDIEEDKQLTDPMPIDAAHDFSALLILNTGIHVLPPIININLTAGSEQVITSSIYILGKKGESHYMGDIELNIPKVSFINQIITTIYCLNIKDRCFQLLKLHPEERLLQLQLSKEDYIKGNIEFELDRFYLQERHQDLSTIHFMKVKK